MASRIDALGIDTSRPGFYNEPGFQAAERGDKKLLQAYADHVEHLSLDDGYLAYARERIVESASFFAERLHRDGRRGACLDASMILGQFLERQGVWNYVAEGALSIRF